MNAAGENRSLLAIRSGVEICVQQLATRGLDTSALRLDRHEHGVDFSQNLQVFEPEHPAVLFLIVYPEQSETVCRALGWSTSGTLGWSAFSPNLERCISFRSVPVVQVKGIKNQSRLSLRVKDTPERSLVFA